MSVLSVWSGISDSLFSQADLHNRRPVHEMLKLGYAWNPLFALDGTVHHRVVESQKTIWLRFATFSAGFPPRNGQNSHHSRIGGGVVRAGPPEPSNEDARSITEAASHVNR